MVFQLLLTATLVGENEYTLKADTNLPDNATVKKVLQDALELMDQTEPEEEDNTSTYKA